MNTSPHPAATIATPMPKKNEWPIFISYRRSDATRRIALELKKELEASTIEATTGQTFALDVFVDVAEAHQSDFQANLVPHLQHSRALIVLADDGAASRKRDGSVDYLYSELDWWANERKKTPPIILQINEKAGSRLVADPQFLAWQNVSFMDCFWGKWSNDGDAGEAEKQQLLDWLRESIRNYGLIIHLDEVRRLKRRTFIAGIFAAAALIAAGFVLLLNQEAESQASMVRAKTANELYQGYLSTVRFASEKVSSGDFNKARQLLLTCPQEHRQWEWWYLMSRCGPTPVTFEKLHGYNDRLFGGMLTDARSRLDALSAKETTETVRLVKEFNGPENKLSLEYDLYKGRGGTTWHAWRGSPQTRVLLNGYYTGMYGGIPAALLDIPLCVYWRVETGEERSTSAMASGEVITQSGDFLVSIRERYIVGDLGALGNARDSNIEYGHAVDKRTWSDDAIADLDPLSLQFAPAEKGLLQVSNSEDQKLDRCIDLEHSIVGSSKADDASVITHISPSISFSEAPTKQAIEACLKEIQTLPSSEKETYEIFAEIGDEGTVLLSTWGYGNIRLRNGKTGLLIGESVQSRLADAESDDFLSPSIYGGRNTVVPGTALVAGWFWWKNKIVVGVVDLKQRELLCEFQDAVGDMGFAYPVNASITAAPNGKEVAFELIGRNEHLFAVWSVASGKLVYGHLGDAGGGELLPEKDSASSAAKNDSHLPSAYSWDPTGKFVVLCRPGGITELRKDFASPPFGHLEGVVPSRDFCVQELGDPKRVLVGNAIVDTETWASVITVSPGTAVSRDGNVAATQTRKAVIDVIQLAVRNVQGEPDSNTHLTLPEKILLYQIREYDHLNPQAK